LDAVFVRCLISLGLTFWGFRVGTALFYWFVGLNINPSAYQNVFERKILYNIYALTIEFRAYLAIN